MDTHSSTPLVPVERQTQIPPPLFLTPIEMLRLMTRHRCQHHAHAISATNGSIWKKRVELHTRTRGEPLLFKETRGPKGQTETPETRLRSTDVLVKAQTRHRHVGNVEEQGRIWAFKNTPSATSVTENLTTGEDQQRQGPREVFLLRCRHAWAKILRMSHDLFGSYLESNTREEECEHQDTHQGFTFPSGVRDL